jgi:septal ring factor EnvC (AmiA/AmiB activator)
MNNNNEEIKELNEWITELQSDNHQLQEEVEKLKEDSKKFREFHIMTSVNQNTARARITKLQKEIEELEEENEKNKDFALHYWSGGQLGGDKRSSAPVEWGWEELLENLD